MRNWIVLMIAVAFCILNVSLTTPFKSVKLLFVHNVDGLKGEFADEDYQKLKELERRFCAVCQDPYSGSSYNEKIEICRRIVRDRKEITGKYTSLNMLNWTCEPSGKCDVGYKER